MIFSFLIIFTYFRGSVLKNNCINMNNNKNKALLINVIFNTYGIYKNTNNQVTPL